jgi:hypothetical protein
MHNGDANFKTLTPRILNLEQNIKGNDFVLHMSHSSLMYNMYVQYVMYSMYVQYLWLRIPSNVQITYFSEH